MNISICLTCNRLIMMGLINGAHRSYFCGCVEGKRKVDVKELVRFNEI